MHLDNSETLCIQVQGVLEGTKLLLMPYRKYCNVKIYCLFYYTYFETLCIIILYFIMQQMEMGIYCYYSNKIEGVDNLGWRCGIWHLRVVSIEHFSLNRHNFQELLKALKSGASVVLSVCHSDVQNSTVQRIERERERIGRGEPWGFANLLGEGARLLVIALAAAAHLAGTPL